MDEEPNLVEKFIGSFIMIIEKDLEMFDIRTLKDALCKTKLFVGGSHKFRLEKNSD
jgi:hypothetical protein